MGDWYKRLDEAPTEEARNEAIKEVLRTNNAARILGLGYSVEEIKSIPFNGNCAQLKVGGKYFTQEPYSTEDAQVYILAVIRRGGTRKFLVLDDSDGVCMEGLHDFMHPDTKPKPFESPYVERKNGHSGQH